MNAFTIIGWACGLVTLLVSTGIQAQEAIPNTVSQLRVGGSAPGVCRIASPTTLSSDNAVFDTRSVNSGQVTITQLANPVNGIARASQISLSFAAVCNVAHSMTIRSLSGGVTRAEGPVAGAFSDRIDYDVEARWAGASVSRRYTGASGVLVIPVADGAAGTLELSLQTIGGGSPLASGRYFEEVIVELAAAS
jgi:hypothetical protein